jgi:hypothetical protein
MNNYGTSQVRLVTRLWSLRVAIAWHPTSLIERDGAYDLDCDVLLQSQLDPYLVDKRSTHSLTSS